MLQVGTILDNKYQVIRHVGSGGMSEVYLLLDVHLNKQWAGKQIKRSNDPEKDELLLRSFQVEAEMMRSLDHPALPRITDILTDDDNLIVVMDFIEGSTLEAVTKNAGAQPQDQVVEWGIQLCDVLDYLHTRNPPRDVVWLQEDEQKQENTWRSFLSFGGEPQAIVAAVGVLQNLDVKAAMNSTEKNYSIRSKA